jgi:hypothetical protein
LGVDDEGRLAVSTPSGGFHDDAPIAYQDLESGRTEVEVAYLLQGTSGSGCGAAWGFHVGAYDESQTLILDPAVLVYCGYIGGAVSDGAKGVAVDDAGCAYVSGWATSDSTTFPVDVGPDLTHNGGCDVFVAKVSADGTGLIYCGYIGGSDQDYEPRIDVDGLGRAYVAGYTQSSQGEGFPVTVGPDLLYSGGWDVFVARVSADGTDLEYCGYIGGELDEGSPGRDVAVDSFGHAYVAGATESSETQGFPVTVGPDLTHNGGVDAFVAKVSADGSGLEYCGYIGGSGTDVAESIEVDPAGDGGIYLAGETSSTVAAGFPATIGPDTSYNGGDYDGWVAMLKADGQTFAYCGYIGGSDWDDAEGVAVDDSGCAYVTGFSASGEGDGFPVLVGPDTTYNGNDDAYVAKVQADGTALEYCGYIGGTFSEEGFAIAVDSEGNAHVAGRTVSSEAEGFPVVAGPDSTHNGDADAFVAKVISDGTSLAYCGYIGGDWEDHPEAITVDDDGNAYVAGWTNSDEATFPTKVGPGLTLDGFQAAWVAKVGWNYPPELGKVFPADGSGSCGEITYFETTWTDQNGWKDLKQCWFHVGEKPTLTGNVTLMYNARKRMLWLWQDRPPSGWIGGHAPGAPGVTVENSQAILYCGLTGWEGADDTLKVKWAIEFKSGFTGHKKTGLKCKDRYKAKAKGDWKGTWTITCP